MNYEIIPTIDGEGIVVPSSFGTYSYREAICILEEMCILERILKIKAHLIKPLPIKLFNQKAQQLYYWTSTLRWMNKKEQKCFKKRIDQVKQELFY